MKNLTRFIKLVLIALVCSVAFLQAKTVDEVVKKEIDFKSSGKVVVKNFNGKIIVTGWDKPVVMMEAEKHAHAGDIDKAESLLKKLKIDIEESHDEIYIRTRSPHRNGDFWSRLFGKNASTSVDYKISLPLDCQLRLESTNGAIEVRDVTGALVIETTNGKIRAYQVGGDIQASTTNGSIRAEVAELPPDGDLDFGTTNGSIKLYLPQKSGFTVRAKTTNGSIRSDFPLNIRGKYNRKRVDGTVNDGGAHLYLETTNGSISIDER